MGAAGQNFQHYDELGSDPEPVYDPVAAQRDYEIIERNRQRRAALEEMFPDPYERMQYCMRLNAQREGRDFVPLQRRQNLSEPAGAPAESPPKTRKILSTGLSTLRGRKGPLAALLTLGAIGLAGAAGVTLLTGGAPVAIGAYAVYAAGCAGVAHMVGYENPNRKAEYMQRVLKGAGLGMGAGMMAGQMLFRGLKKILKLGLYTAAIGAGVLVAGGIAGAIAGPVFGAGVIVALGSIGAFAGMMKLIGAIGGGPQMPEQQMPPQMPQGHAPVSRQRSVSREYNNVSTNDNNNVSTNDSSNDEERRRAEYDANSRTLTRTEFLATGGQNGAPTY